MGNEYSISCGCFENDEERTRGESGMLQKKPE